MPEKASVTTAELTGASIIIEAIDRMQGLIDLINEMMLSSSFNMTMTELMLGTLLWPHRSDGERHNGPCKEHI